MRRLEILLNKYADSVKCSQTSNSRYYHFKDIIVRYSDHFAFNNTVSINIVYPHNPSDYYAVFGINRYFMLNAKQTMDFIKKSIPILLLRLKHESKIEQMDTEEEIELPTSNEVLQFTAKSFKECASKFTKRNLPVGPKALLLLNKAQLTPNQFSDFVLHVEKGISWKDAINKVKEQLINLYKLNTK